MKRLSISLVAAVLPALVWWAGCSNPVAHPQQPEKIYEDGSPLTQDSLSGANPVIHIGNSPYLVTSNLVIPEGATLTIEPGVKLMFYDHDSLLWMKIQGKLIAEGDPNNPIIFTTARVRPDYGQWRGLAFLNPTEQSVVRYCIFEYGAYFELDTMTARGKEAQLYAGMLAVLNSSPIIENNIIFYNQNNGVYVKGNLAYPTVRYNIIFKNDAAAVRGDSGTFGRFIPEYNCGAENSSLDFLMEDSLFGRKDTVNTNLDSTDVHFNFTTSPEFMDWENGDFHLQSCSPCIDAGPPDVQGASGDLGRIDFGAFPYVKTAAELRGVQSGTLNAETYRMSCHVRIPPGETLTIPAGATIDVSGYFNLEVLGTLIVQGTATNRVTFHSASATASKGDWGAILFRADSLQTQPSQISYTTFENFDSVVVNQAGATFTGCVFRGGFTAGMWVNTGSDDGSHPVTIEHCQFDDLGVYGIKATQSTIIVHNSLVENCMGDGILVIGSPPLEDLTSRFYNNVIRNCSVSGIACQDFASPQIINNAILTAGYGGVLCDNNARPLTLNNIIIHCGRPGIIARNSASPTVDYNDVWLNNTLGDSSTNYQGIDLPDGNQNISTDPLFVPGSLAVLQESPTTSPCIDAGDPDAEYQDSNGSRNDMGAYGGPNGGGIGPSITRGLTMKSVRR
jgi:parallel beta-helix repeat protein